MAKRSLLEELATLEKPDDFDIEDDERQDVFNSGSESEAEPDIANDHYVSVSKSKLRDNSAKGLGGKYVGQKSSRKDFEDIEFEDAEFDSEAEEEGEDDQVDESDSGESLRENSDSEEEEEEGEGEDEDETEDLEYKRQQLATLLAKERSHIVNKLSENAMNDALKGYAIQEQHKTFDKIIDGRLKLQKAVQLSNQLPYNADIIAHEELATAKTEKYIKKAKNSCYDLLDAVFALRNKLMEEEKVGDAVAVPKKRSFAEYNRVTTEFDTKINDYRQEVLVKWSAKVQNSQGSSAINQAKFKSINQSYEQQVANHLNDMDRLVKRTCLNRRQIKPLGVDYYLTTVDTGVSEEQQEDEENPDIPKQVQKVGVVELAGIFDDDDFYRVLLNDLVDKKIQSQNPTSGLTIMKTAQKAQKLSKNVDTRASKGRKLRYNIQEKIANFEAPREKWRWDDQQIDEFFAGLLGQKVNMNEEEEKETGDAEDDVVVDSGIQLFG